MTPAEALLCRRIRNRRLGNLKFRRQAPFGPFVVDFACDEARLVIELDGAVHDLSDAVEQDTYRSAFIETYGYHVVRFRNEEISQNMHAVLQQILALAQARLRQQPS